MLLHKSNRFDANIRSSDITPQEAFENHQQARRRFLTGAATLGAGVIAATHIPGLIHPAAEVHAADDLHATPSQYTTTEPQTPFNKATSYNNFYEFGTDKSDPSHNAGRLPTRPWPIQITGMVKKPQIGRAHV